MQVYPSAIGEALRTERERQGVSLEDICFHTRIPVHYLRAIEDDRFDSLPALVFTRSFVRQYADSLHMEAEPLISMLPKPDESTAQLPIPPDSRYRTRWEPQYGRALSFLLWVALATGATAAAYVHFNQAQPHQSAPVLTESEAELQPAPKIETSPASINVARHDAATMDAAKIDVALTATQDAWVQIAADGQPAFTGLLKPGEKKDIAAANDVRLIAGNAGGLTISLNGKALYPLGAKGQVRIVKLTAEGPQFLTRDQQPEAVDR